MKPTVRDAYELLHEGSLALAEVEAAGMRIDTQVLDNTIRQIGKEIEATTEQLKADPLWAKWRRRFADKASLGSRYQLAAVLREAGFDVGKSMDEEDLGNIDLPFAGIYRHNEKLKKLKGTYLLGVRREVVDGWLHGIFNLHLARTYRGSADSPNLQNIPNRDPEIGKFIRSCFIPRDGHVFIELDYAQLEVRIAACYNRDPKLIKYILDPTADMHRDMAAQCYLLPIDGVTKEARSWVKNQFVFPEFYGSYYVQVAPGLWHAIEKSDLKTVDGVPMKKHLRSKGIKSLGDCLHDTNPRKGTFEYHIQQVEKDFWGRRFKVYAQWRIDWFNRYQKDGGFDLKTGFRCDGVFKRNDVINYPVQGAAFHCLLWSMTRLVQWLRKRKMRSVIVNNIHDSIVADVHRDEIDEFVKEARRIMTEDVREHWPWIVVPLEVEMEMAEKNWFEKTKMKG